jgi:predicted amidohydrolase YtcJ
MDGHGPYQGPTKVLVDNEADARAAVDDFAAKGYAQIKIYSSMKPELVPVIAKEAHAKGMRVSGHVPVHMIAEDAVNAGYDELQHINFLVLDLVGDRTTETQTPLRLSIPASKAADIDLDSLATLGAARVMKRDAHAGSIAKGKDADLVIVDGDPLTNMRDVRNTVTVVKSGIVIDAVAAQLALSIAPR